MMPGLRMGSVSAKVTLRYAHESVWSIAGGGSSTTPMAISGICFGVSGMLGGSTGQAGDLVER